MQCFEMRRTDRKLDEKNAFEILEKGNFGILSTIGSDGYPYGVPVNYVFVNEKIYFHCAKNVGHKEKNLINSNKVSFTVVTKSDVCSEKMTTKYESTIAFGIAEKTFTEKEFVLRELVKKYSPNNIPEGEKHIEKSFNACDIFAIKIEKLTAKANR